MRSGNRDRVPYHSRWADCDPWVEQLYGEHGYQTTIVIHLHADRHGLKPAVTLSLVKPAKVAGDVALYQDWKVFDPKVQGAAEACALALLSKALLQMDNEKARAVAAQTSLWDK